MDAIATDAVASPPELAVDYTEARAPRPLGPADGLSD
jgi:hypothetical protein